MRQRRWRTAARHVASWQIVLQNSFYIADRKFSGPWTRLSGKHVRGPHHTVMNSPAASVTILTPYQSAISTCFVFWRENCRLTFSDFCNTIGTKPTKNHVCFMVAMREKVDMPAAGKCRE
jgi:hypothetical protein